MNIGQIAELAGVSSATVSRYLNNGYVSQANKEKIQKIIDETGYRPSVYAKTLRTKKSSLIGVIIPRVSSEAVSRIVDGISERLSESGYDVLLGNTNLNVKKEIEYLKIFERNQVEGIIFLATVITPEHLKVMKGIKVPIVILGQEVEGYTSIYHEDYKAGFKMTEHLIQQGYENIGLIGVTEKDQAVGYKRKQGYLDALKKYNKRMDEQMMEEALFSTESGYECMKKLYKNNPKLDSVFCVTDTIAVGAMTYLREQGIKVPNQVGIGSIGDYKISKAVVPSLTTLHYYYKTSGREAAKLVLEQANETSSLVKKLQLGFELNERESTKR